MLCTPLDTGATKERTAPCEATECVGQGGEGGGITRWAKVVLTQLACALRALSTAPWASTQSDVGAGESDHMSQEAECVHRENYYSPKPGRATEAPIIGALGDWNLD